MMWVSKHSSLPIVISLGSTAMRGSLQLSIMDTAPLRRAISDTVQTTGKTEANVVRVSALAGNTDFENFEQFCKKFYNFCQT